MSLEKHQRQRNMELRPFGPQKNTESKTWSKIYYLDLLKLKETSFKREHGLITKPGKYDTYKENTSFIPQNKLKIIIKHLEEFFFWRINLTHSLRWSLELKKSWQPKFFLHVGFRFHIFLMKRTIWLSLLMYAVFSDVARFTSA